MSVSGTPADHLRTPGAYVTCLHTDGEVPQADAAPEAAVRPVHPSTARWGSAATAAEQPLLI